MTSTPGPTVPQKEGEPSNPFARAARPRGLHSWLPVLALVHTYQSSWLAKDLVAGLVLTAHPCT